MLTRVLHIIKKNYSKLSFPMTKYKISIVFKRQKDYFGSKVNIFLIVFS